MPKRVAQRQHIVRVKKGPTVRGLGVFVHKNKIYLFFQSKENSINDFSVSESTDGFSFSKDIKTMHIEKRKGIKENIKDSKNFNIYDFNNEFILTYQQFSGKKRSAKKAWSKKQDFSFKYEGEMLNFFDLGLIVPNLIHDKKFVMYGGAGGLNLYFSKNLVEWEKALKVSEIALSKAHLEAAWVLNTQKGVLMLYYSKIKGLYSIGVLLFDSENPGKLLWHSKEPIWVSPVNLKDKLSPVGTVLHAGRLISYWQTKENGIFASITALFKISDGHESKDISLRLKRVKQNPIISPDTKNHWEAFNTFNPAAFYDDGKVHILYRAQGYDYISVLGYAISKDGVNIDERLDQPVYVPFQNFESRTDKGNQSISYNYVSGGGYGGCEDPRITKIDDRYYLTYVAFDGYNPPRIALTSIAVDNFLNRRFLWEKPVLISPPGVVDKSAVIFPEKINNKYVIMHRIYPDILIDFVDTLDFDGKTWLSGANKISPRPKSWDSRKIGAGAPPVKTKYGWLLIYQSVGEQDSGKYKIGAMLLDLKDPTKVLQRSQSPILEPDAKYENEGFKSGVIYPCGAVVISDTLYVYYGGADSYVCVATANLEEFLKELRFSEVAKLTEPVFEKIF